MLKPDESHPVLEYFDSPLNVSWSKLQAGLKGTEKGRNILHDTTSLTEDYYTAKLYLAGNLKDSLKSQIVYCSGTDYQAPLLQRNPNYKRQMRMLFPDGIIYHRMFHTFFQLKQKLMAKVTNYSSNNFRQHTLGIQLRTQKIPVVASQFCDIAKAILEQKSANPESTTIFIATDGREKIWDMFTECLPQYNIKYIYDSEGKTIAGNPGSEAGGLIGTFLLLSFSPIFSLSHSFPLSLPPSLCL